MDHHSLPSEFLTRLERELDRILDLSSDDRERALRDLEAIDLTLGAYARWAMSAPKSVLDRGVVELAQALNASNPSKPTEDRA